MLCLGSLESFVLLLVELPGFDTCLERQEEKNESQDDLAVDIRKELIEEDPDEATNKDSGHHH